MTNSLHPIGLLNAGGNETIGLPGTYYKETTQELMWGNKLFTEELIVAGKPANLSEIKIPLMHIVAEHDHIATYGSNKTIARISRVRRQRRSRIKRRTR